MTINRKTYKKIPLQENTVKGFSDFQRSRKTAAIWMQAGKTGQRYDIIMDFDRTPDFGLNLERGIVCRQGLIMWQ